MFDLDGYHAQAIKDMMGQAKARRKLTRDEAKDIWKEFKKQFPVAAHWVTANRVRLTKERR